MINNALGIIIYPEQNSSNVKKTYYSKCEHVGTIEVVCCGEISHTQTHTHIYTHTHTNYMIQNGG